MQTLIRILIIILIFLYGSTYHVIAQEKSRNGMVVSAHRIASEIGIKILKDGGNAIDAAVAVGFALAVVFPEAGNIGGGGFLLFRNNEGKVICLDFREKAPKKIATEMFLDSSGNVTRDIIRGCKSAGVPGTVAGLVTAQKKYGRFNFKQVIQPAIDVALNGFIVDENLSENLCEYEKEFKEYESTVKVFTRNGNLYKEGDTLYLKDLAETLCRIRDTEGKDFYNGKTAELIVNEVNRGGGFITKDDLMSYDVVERIPVKGIYRGYEIYSVPPPSSGGICLISILNILEGFNLTNMGFHSSSSVHTMVEAMKLVYSDRAYYLGDPAYNDIPVEWLISKQYAQERIKNIDSMVAKPSSEINMNTQDKKHTTHYSVIDKDGNCVAVTYTINDLFGSQVIVDGAGFFLNNEMDDFSVKPGVSNSYGLTGGKANCIEPGKRPLSSMTPTILVKDNKPFLILGARGGSRIITAVLQVIVNIIDYGMNVQNAVNMPRFHHQWIPDEIVCETFCLPVDVIYNLGLKGHKIRNTESSCGEIEAIYIDSAEGWIYGGADFRENGVVAGY